MGANFFLVTGTNCHDNHVTSLATIATGALEALAAGVTDNPAAEDKTDPEGWRTPNGQSAMSPKAKDANSVGSFVAANFTTTSL